MPFALQIRSLMLRLTNTITYQTGASEACQHAWQEYVTELMNFLDCAITCTALRA
jgi:hypothetical protein